MSRYDSGGGGSSAGKIILIVLGIVGAVVVVVVLVCAGVIYFVVNRAQQTVASIKSSIDDIMESQMAADKFMNDLSFGNVDTAYNSTSQTFKDRQSLAAFRKMVDSNPILKNNTGRFANNQGVTGTSSSFIVTMNNSTGQSTTASLRLVKEGKEWKVDQFDIKAMPVIDKPNFDKGPGFKDKPPPF